MKLTAEVRMSRKQTRKQKLINVCMVGLILFTCFSCATIDEKQKTTRLKSEEAQEHLLRAKDLFEQRDYDGAVRENQRVLSLAGQNSPADEALFNLALIYAHSGNPRKDYRKSISFFRKLTKDYPQSPFSLQARIWAGVLMENEKLSQTIQKLNQVIEESKQVDIEIEEKKREKVK